MPKNGQALLGMSDTDILNIIKINIDSLGAEDARDSKWCASKHTVQESELKQETDRAEKCYPNMDSISKSGDNNTKPMVKTKFIKQQNISLQVQTMKVTRKRVLNPRNEYVKTSLMYLMVLGALKAHCCCS